MSGYRLSPATRTPRHHWRRHPPPPTPAKKHLQSFLSKVSFHRLNFLQCFALFHTNANKKVLVTSAAIIKSQISTCSFQFDGVISTAKAKNYSCHNRSKKDWRGWFPCIWATFITSIHRSSFTRTRLFQMIHRMILTNRAPWYFGICYFSFCYKTSH